MEPKKDQKTAKGWIAKNTAYIWLWLFLTAFMLVWLYPRIIYTIDAGHAGVKWKRFFAGTETDRVYLEGIQWTWPWDDLTIYDIRVSQIENEFSVISKNGLTIKIVLSIRFRPELETLPELHRQVGLEYPAKIIIPETQSLVRSVFGQFSPDEIYRTKRGIIQKALSEAVAEIGERFIIVDDLLIKSIQLPDSVRLAIEEKLTEEQRYLAMEYRLQKEEQEAARIIIQGLGINAYNMIIAESLTPDLLQYRGIEATVKLSESNNSKIVVIGRSEDGLPIILDTTSSSINKVNNESEKTNSKTNSITKGLTSQMPKLGFQTTSNLVKEKIKSILAIPELKNLSQTNRLSVPAISYDATTR